MSGTTTNRETLDTKRAAMRLGISDFTLRRMVAKQEITFVRLGSGRGRLAFDEQHLADYLRRRTVEAKAA